ncbi:YceI family protein [Luteolibacter pohnpeiensis]|uniref:YceI family protein n=1 Tax=Luteolibacter pohnpeiensis TaxID=454153 RepID=A0A934VUL2_9BACT|nr:YceI family protein [Luteolibacter pohnpeiensis]MBK1880868.1 YceI family protein [Luteolibacter pohnpeiensis]
MKFKYLALAATAPVLFASCENPADKTEAAKVAPAVEKADDPAVVGTKYTFTANSEIHFIGSKVTGSHNGGFKTFSGYFTIKDGEPTGLDHKVEITMDSAWADDDKLTTHLKSSDFFDVDQYPKSTFDVTSIKKDSETGYTVAGNLTLHGVTKNISFPATVTRNSESVAIYSKFDINRKDFNIVYAGKADDLIRDEVVVELKMEAKPEA